jgi:hypothetical protein
MDFRRLSDGNGVCADKPATEAKNATESIAKRNIVMPPMSWREAFLSNLSKLSNVERADNRSKFLTARSCNSWEVATGAQWVTLDATLRHAA